MTGWTLVARAPAPSAQTEPDTQAPTSSSNPLILPPANSGLPAAELTFGIDVEGLRESWGLESLLDIEPYPPIEISESSNLGYREHVTSVLAVLGCALRPRLPGAWRSYVDLEGRSGAERRALSIDAGVSRRPSEVGGWSARSQLLWEREDEDDDGSDPVETSLSTTQSTSRLKWNPGPRWGAWCLSTRGTADISWARTERAAEDSLADLYASYLDYRRLSTGVGLVSEGDLSGSVFLDLTRKWLDSGDEGSYEGLALEFLRGSYSSRGSLLLEARALRRRYLSPHGGDASAAGLRSYWEGLGHLSRELVLRRAEIDCDFDVTVTRYDPSRPRHDPASDLLTLESVLDDVFSDRLRLQWDGQVSVELLRASDGTDTEEPSWGGRWLESLRYRAGLVADRLWLRGGDGDCQSLGAKLGLDARGGARLGAGWLELAIETGVRDYLADGQDLVLDLEGVSFSLAESDCVFIELSALGGGRLPLGCEWDLLATLDQESHATRGDDVRVFTLSLGLRHRWPVMR